MVTNNLAHENWFFDFLNSIETPSNPKKEVKKKVKRIKRAVVFTEFFYLATEWAETEGIKEASLTDMAGIGDTFSRPRLRPLVQEHNFGTVYYICLDSCNVQIFLNLRHPYYIMIWWPPYLQNPSQNLPIIKTKSLLINM